jgi:hypothetical protein
VSSALNILDVVALLVDDRDHGLVRGQVGTVVEQLADGVFEVDFCDEEGRTYAEIAVSVEALLRLRYCRT